MSGTQWVFCPSPELSLVVDYVPVQAAQAFEHGMRYFDVGPISNPNTE